MSSITNTLDYPEENSTRKLDEVFAAWVVRNFSQDSGEKDSKRLEHLAKAVSHALHLKHTCLDLASYEGLADPVLNDLLKDTSADDVCGFSDKAIGVKSPGTRSTPLVRSLDGQLIWLQKYHSFEMAVDRKIAKRDEVKINLCDALMKDLDHLYGGENKDQRAAVMTALSHRFSVITGGPGTGKTYTVARIIALMLKHGVGDQAKPRIALAAPTGKAANRMHQSLLKALRKGKIEEIIGDNALPDKATTLHSLLKIYRGSPKARHDATNPLPVDVLVVDEASMIDLPMMYRILQALPDSAHLILLGDKDQLSSVEAGSVLGALCVSDKLYIAKIEKSYRYEDSPGIGELAVAINEDRSLPYNSNHDHVTWCEQVKDGDPWKPAWLDETKQQVKALKGHIVNDKKVSRVLKNQTNFQILCAFRKGPYGVSGINAMVERKLGKKANGWYAGCPVMILSNDHQRKLYNGDVGLVLSVREQKDGKWVIDNDKGKLRACFPIGEEEVKTISLAQMPAFETCYAMTVHKSQGSEYKKVLFVLPEDKDEVEKNPVITKELVYTGITRAKESVDIWSGEGVMEAAVNKKTVRMSGLGKHQQEIAMTITT